MSERHFGFNDQQNAAGRPGLQGLQVRLKWYYEGDKAPGAGPIQEYLLECDRLAEAKKESSRKVAFRRDWIDRKEAELRSKARSLAGRPAMPWVSSSRELYTKSATEAVNRRQRASYRDSGSVGDGRRHPRQIHCARGWCVADPGAVHAVCLARRYRFPAIRACRRSRPGSQDAETTYILLSTCGGPCTSGPHGHGSGVLRRSGLRDSRTPPAMLPAQEKIEI